MKQNNLNKLTVLNWLWHYRKLLVLEACLLGLLELLYFHPVLLGWWLVGIIVLIMLLGWWVGNSRLNKSTWLLTSELLWLVLGGIGFLSFSVLNLWQVQLIIGVVLVLSALVAYWHQNQIDYQKWDLDAINWLGLIDLLVLFVTTVSLVIAVQFYSLSVFWLMLGLGIQLILGLYLLFWRRGLSERKFWLYAIILTLIGEQLVWITYAWHKSAYFKAFLVLTIYYLYSDFVMHYIRGNLTIKTVLEYVSIAIFLIAILFFFDLISLFIFKV